VKRLALLFIVALFDLVGAPASARTLFLGPHGNPVAALPKANGPRFVIGVMGGAGKRVPPRISGLLQQMGDEIGRLGHVTLTGACPGFPHDVLRAAKKAGGFTVGISGHRDLKSHVAHGAPTDSFDAIQFTSLPFVHRGQTRPNYMGREIDNIERSHALIFVGGRSGTLGEFAIAYEEGRPIGVLSGSGGVADEVKRLVKVMTKEGKPPRAPVIYDSNPRRLVRRLIDATANHKENGVQWEG
jgi:predicted Rossmann-fold nucleotide-binding protein